MYDLLASTDLLVEAAAPVVECYVERLGILPAQGFWAQTWPDWGFDAHWCRVRRSLPHAPTQLEIIAPAGPRDPTINHPHLAEIAGQQGARRHKTHSIPIACADLAGLVDRLDAKKLTYRLDPPEGALPLPRLWIGRVAGRPLSYDPTVDGGLYFEFLDTSDLGLDIASEPPSPVRSETNISRIVARTVLVEDLDEVLSLLDRNFGWTTPDPVAQTNGSKRARLSFTHAMSAQLELIEPVDSGTPENDYFGRWGAGPYGIRLEMEDLEHACQRLEASGTCHREVERAGRPVLLVDPEVMYGPQIELVQRSEETP